MHFPHSQTNILSSLRVRIFFQRVFSKLRSIFANPAFIDFQICKKSCSVHLKIVENRSYSYFLKKSYSINGYKVFRATIIWKRLANLFFWKFAQALKFNNGADFSGVGLQEFFNSAPSRICSRKCWWLEVFTYFIHFMHNCVLTYVRLRDFRILTKVDSTLNLCVIFTLIRYNFHSRMLFSRFLFE